MFIPRQIQAAFDMRAAHYPAVALVGARQAGKSTFLQECAKTGDANYATFDDPDARRMFESDVKKFDKQFLEGHVRTILDEAHLADGAGPKIKYLLDKGRKLWLSSSSEKILGREVLGHLVGRISILRLYPFSLPEFLSARQIIEPTPQMLQRTIWEQVVWGSYPKVVTTQGADAKAVLLSDLRQTLLLRDITQVFSISDIRPLEDLSRILAHQKGGLVSYESLCSQLDLSFVTLKKYLDAMEAAYLILRVRPFYRNKAKEINKQAKIYFLDTGMRNAIAGQFPKQIEGEGMLFENYVLGELVKLDLDVSHWRTRGGAEVDFIVRNQEDVIPIEVKMTGGPDEIPTGLRAFVAEYRPKNALVVSYHGEAGERQLDETKIRYVDALEMIRILGPIRPVGPGI